MRDRNRMDYRQPSDDPRAMRLRLAQAFLVVASLALLWVIWWTWPPHVAQRRARHVFECRETADPATCLTVRYGWSADSAQAALR